MNTDERREQILYTLKQTNTPITGSELANIFKVSRQIIVGDITVLELPVIIFLLHLEVIYYLTTKQKKNNSPL
mgnify:CR=1 FL=1